MARKKCAIIGEITDFDYHGNWGDFTSARFVKAFLDTLTEHDEAEIEINSPGGSVIQGIEIANAIKNCKAKIVAHVTGMAASMASVIACACDSIELDEASFVMIHDPWSYAIGNAEELRKQAAILDQMKTIIMSFYRGAFKGKTEDEISELMSDETWYTANECKENGLVCTVISSDYRAAASIVGHKFDKMPEGAAKFLTSKDITEEGKAEIDAAKAAAETAAKAEADAADAKAKAEAAAEEKARLDSEAKAAQAKSEAAKREVEEKSSGAQAIAPESADGDWEARYKGASKKINELQAKLEKAELDTVDHGAIVEERDSVKKELVATKEELERVKAERDDLKKELGAANAEIKDFEDQVKNAGFENLAALVGAVSGLKSDLENRDRDLADCRQQLDHMKETRDLLTGAVLTPGNGAAKYSSFSDAVDAIGFVEACRKYPELRASYRKHK